MVKCVAEIISSDACCMLYAAPIPETVTERVAQVLEEESVVQRGGFVCYVLIPPAGYGMQHQITYGG